MNIGCCVVLSHIRRHVVLNGETAAVAVEMEGLLLERNPAGGYIDMMLDSSDRCPLSIRFMPSIE